MPGPGKLKDVAKSAKDIKIGSVKSFKVSLKSKTSNETQIETSQEVEHKGQSALTALSMKFKKSDGLRLDKVDFDTNGKLAGSIAITNPSPGVDVSIGAERSKGEKDTDFSDSVFASVSYAQDLLCFNGKLDFVKKSFTADALVGYENLLIGGKLDLDGVKTEVKDFSGALGLNWGDSNRITLEGSKKQKFTLTSYLKAADDIEVSVVSNVKRNDDGKAWDMDATVASKFSLDNNGTSLTSSVTTSPIKRDKFTVGLSYAQKLRDYAELTVSGEVGIVNVDYAAFGIALKVGDL